MILSPFRGLAVSVSVLLLAQTSSAFWRLPCNTPLIAERVDPIVNRGLVSGHVHTVSGASGFSPNSTFNSMRESDCTSCLVKQDLSAYWTPALYFHWANGSFTLVDQVGGGTIYYLQRYNDADTTEILAFPDGFRMLTGSPFLRSYTPGLMSDAIGWDCLGGSGRNPWLPTENCPNGLRGEIRFPSCWNGVDLDSSDHFSHMAYSDGESGPCPSTHSSRVVTIFFEMMWSVDSWKNLWDQAMNKSQPFVVSTGDPTGYSYHGDFLNGWDHDVLQTAIRNCTDDSGVIQNCPVFDLQANSATCKKTPDVNEIVTGTLNALPGCNPVSSGPANATSCKAPTTPPLFTSPVAYTGLAQPPGASVLSNTPAVLESHDVWVYKDCYSDSVSNRALPNGLNTVNQTVEACLDACKTANYTLCGVEYHGQCWGANELMGGSVPLGYGACGLVCNGNGLQYCGGGNPTAMELYVRGSLSNGGGSSTSSTTTTTSVKTSSSVSVSTTSSASATVVLTSSGTTTTNSATTTATNSTSVKTSTSKTSTVSTTSTTSASTVGQTSSVTTSSSATSSPSQIPGKLSSSRWTYSGCFSDRVQGRSLPNQLSSNSTIEGCLAASDAAGFAVAGLSYMGECWAGGALSPASSALDASRCQMQCTNAPSETCGGAAALDVYISKTVPLIKSPTTPDFAEISGYSYKGCYSDLVNNQRSLSKSLSSNATVEGCIAACAKAGMTICGLEYYGECWAGTTISTSSTTIDASKCTFSCKNNPLEHCGGAAALSVYTLSSNSKRAVRNHIRPGRRYRSWGH